jgi:hypothetical protein
LNPEKIQLLAATKKIVRNYNIMVKKNTFMELTHLGLAHTDLMAIELVSIKVLLTILVSLSSYKNANHFSVPKGDRGLLYIRKDDSVNPFSYPNPNEIYVKAVAKKDGAYSMPKS